MGISISYDLWSVINVNTVIIPPPTTTATHKGTHLYSPSMAFVWRRVSTAYADIKLSRPNKEPKSSVVQLENSRSHAGVLMMITAVYSSSLIHMVCYKIKQNRSQP